MQPVNHSLMEQFLNVASGFVTAALAWEYIVRPLILAGTLSVESTLPITTIFTIISFVRGFVWRRLFNWYLVRGKK